MTIYNPIVLPSPNNAAWGRAKVIAGALRERKKQNPFQVAALVDGFAESWWTSTAVGDNDQSYGPWQLKKQFYREPILSGVKIDICDPRTTLVQHVDALLFALAMPANKTVSDALDAATTGENATRLFAGGFERASAGGAVERRVAIAAPIEVWLAKLPA